MARRQHLCSVPGCENLCLKNYPFCASCWWQVSGAERAEIVQGMAKQTSDEDPEALRFAIAGAIESVRAKTTWGPRYLFWEYAYYEAGQPEL